MVGLPSQTGERDQAGFGAIDVALAGEKFGVGQANPDVIIFLLGGDDMLHGLKQAVQFGLDKMLHLAGAHQELEPLEGLPPEARIGAWVMEWYWMQPGVPHVVEFVSVVKKRTRRVPTARTY
jgi:branched-chain amino acid transport system substrate-binding protein